MESDINTAWSAIYTKFRGDAIIKFNMRMHCHEQTKIYYEPIAITLEAILRPRTVLELFQLY